MTVRLALGILLCLGALLPGAASAQSLLPDTETLARARVVHAGESTTDILPGTDAVSKAQELSAVILDGPERGRTVSFRNDFTQLAAGDEFYLKHLVSPSEGMEFWSVADPYRLDVLIALAALFLVLVALFGGLQGLRGLASLAGSFVLIFYVLLPGITHGYPPVLVSIGVASLIIVGGSYLTHGFNRTTSSAVLGMIATIVVTGFLAWYAVHAALLSGYSSEESTYLHFQFKGQLDLVGVALGGILIGLLGVLYDSAIGQAVAVEELLRAGKHLTRRAVFLRALRIGREHIGALVNTLAIAYVGAALPLLLLLGGTDAPLGYLLNGEVFATEIIRILIGSIGLVLAVPATTVIAVFLVRPQDDAHATMHVPTH